MEGLESRFILGILLLFLGLFFLSFHKKIIDIQGGIEEGHYSDEIRRKNFKAFSYIAVIGGIILIIKFWP